MCKYLYLIVAFYILCSNDLFSQVQLWANWGGSPEISNIIEVDDILLSKDSTIYVLGASRGEDGLKRIPLIYKFSFDGKQHWLKSIKNNHSLQPIKFIKEYDNKIKLLCSRPRVYSMEGTVDFRPYIFEIDTSGTVISEKIDTLSVQTSIFDNYGSFFIGRHDEIYNLAEKKGTALLKKYDSNGVFISEAVVDSFPGGAAFSPFETHITKDEHYFVFGAYATMNVENSYFISYFDKDFSLIWRKIILINDINKYVGSSIIDDNSTTLLFGGWQTPHKQDYNNAKEFLIQIDSDSNFVNEKYFGQSYYDRLSSIIRNQADNGIIVGGYRTDSTHTSHYSYLVTKFDSLFNLKWEYKWTDLSDKCIIDKVTSYPNGDIIACGVSSAGDEYTSLFIMKLHDNSIISVKEPNPNDLIINGISISPNPASAAARVEISGNFTGAKVELFDIFGVPLRTYLRSGFGSFDIDLESVPPGVYYLRLSAGGMVSGRKLVVVR